MHESLGSWEVSVDLFDYNDKNPGNWSNRVADVHEDCRRNSNKGEYWMIATVAADDPGSPLHGQDIVAVGIALGKKQRTKAAKLALAATVALQRHVVPGSVAFQQLLETCDQSGEK